MSIEHLSDAVEPGEIPPQDRRLTSSTPRSAAKRWTARVGLLGGIFFLGKGLVWLTVAALAIDGCAR